MAATSILKMAHIPLDSFITTSLSNCLKRCLGLHIIFVITFLGPEKGPYVLIGVMLYLDTG